jgi:beta-lactamase class D
LEQSSTLRIGLNESRVWCYQQIASKLRKANYKKYLKSMAHGNLSDDSNLTKFWLDDALKTSALEQVDFLKKLYWQELPFSGKAFGI